MIHLTLGNRVMYGVPAWTWCTESVPLAMVFVGVLHRNWIPGPCEVVHRSTPELFSLRTRLRYIMDGAKSGFPLAIDTEPMWMTYERLYAMRSRVTCAGPSLRRIDPN